MAEHLSMTELIPPRKVVSSLSMSPALPRKIPSSRPAATRGCHCVERSDSDGLAIEDDNGCPSGDSMMSAGDERDDERHVDGQGMGMKRELELQQLMTKW